MKKLLSMVLLICMMTGLLACGAAAQEICSDSEHNSYYNGLCRKCGKPCAHIELSPVKTGAMNQSEYFMVNEQIHAFTQDIGRFQECERCHAEIVLETSETGMRIEQAHRFLDGACWFCGYVNECEHKHTTETVEKQTVDSEPLDAQYHRAIYEEIRYIHCDDCNEMLSRKRIPNAGATKEEHAIDSDNGFCRMCGYGKELCTHSELYSVDTGRMNQSEYFAVDDQIHAYTYDIGEYQECVNCSAEIALEITRKGIRVEEAHSYSDGVCSKCGYVNVCTHKNTHQVTELDVGYTDGEPVDEHFHRISYDENIRIYCTDCGEKISNQTKRNAGTLNEAHVFDVGTILCEACGYRRESCSHANQDIGYYYYEHYDSPENVTYNELRHTYDAKRYASMICKDCGEYTEDVLVNTERITEEHWYDDGVCQVCGFDPDDCTHQHVRMISEFDADWRRSVSLNDQEHKVYGEMVEYEYCAACQSRVGDLKITKTNCYEIYPHQFSQDGKCLDCEYRIQCSHLEMTESDWLNSARNAVYLDDNTHVLYMDRMIETICVDCGVYFDDRVAEQNVALVEEHTYSNNGVCTVCEYKRGSYTETTPEMVPDPYADAQVIESGVGEMERSIADMEKMPVDVPTIVSRDIPLNVELVFEQKESGQENTLIYDISLQTADGHEYKLTEEVLLILPYPEGMDQTSTALANIAIIHYGEKEEKFSVADGSLELYAQGFGVRVRSFSPFVIVTEEVPVPELPQTGDESHLLLWMVTLMMAAGLLGRRRAAKNG